MTDADGLRIDTYWTSGAARLVVGGDLDVSTAPVLASILDDVCRNMPTAMLIDLTDVAFCDSTGLKQFVRYSTICDERGTDFRVVGASGVVRRVFEIAGLDHLISEG